MNSDKYFRMKDINKGSKQINKLAMQEFNKKFENKNLVSQAD